MAGRPRRRAQRAQQNGDATWPDREDLEANVGRIGVDSYHIEFLVLQSGPGRGGPGEYVALTSGVIGIGDQTYGPGGVVHYSNLVAPIYWRRRG